MNKIIKLNFFYLLIVCLAQISLLTLSFKSYSQTITIGNGGDFATLSQAASSLNPGDRVVILNQVFSNGTQYMENINGLPGQPITIVAETNQVPVFRGGSEAIHLSNCNHITIDGLVFEQQTQNSLNIDDGTNYATPSTNITVRNCVFRDIGANGNHDFLKMSGVDDFLVSNCTFTNGDNSGLGSGLDMVGCHKGLIQNCFFDGAGSIGVSGKGGTRYVTIERNVFKNTDGRAVAVGGFSDAPFFRPPLPSPVVNGFEASDINVFSNVFMNNEAPIAFVGAVNCTFRNNTIYKPQNWVMRILQENTRSGFLPCSNNEFSNNIVYLQNDLVEVNISPNTDPGSFTFSHNGWYNESSQNWSPDLPATSQNRLISNPLFVNAANGDFTLSNQSPFIENGFPYGTPATDFSQTAYSNPPSRGAFEGGESPNCPQQEQTCDDGNDCTTGETYNANCNCTGGISQDADNDGVCAALDPNDNDPCVPNSCGEEECELLVNTDFDNGLSPWEYWGANDVSVVDGMVNIKDIETVVNRWDVGFSQNQRNITLVQGESYTLTFRARADANRPLYLYVGMENSPWKAYHLDSYALTSTMQKFSATFTMTDPTDTNIRFDFNLGDSTINTYIEYADLQKADCEPPCPQQGQRCDDGNDCTTGETYDANCNCTGGVSQDADDDGICAALDPDDNDPCVPVSCNEGDCELLLNGNFDSDLAPWDYWECNATSVNGVATLTNIINGQNVWDAAFYTDNILIEQGESYEVKFRARADVNRTMGVKVGQNEAPFLDDLYQTVNLTTNMTDFSMNFTMNRPTDYNTAFNFFIAGGNTANIYIDNVSLKKVDCGMPQPSGQCDCPDAVEPGNTVIVSNVSQLRNAINQAGQQGGNMTIKLEPGIYQIDYTLVINPDMVNLTIMGTTRNRDDVFIKGLGAFNSAVGAVILVQADNFTVAHLTVGESSTHAIQVQGDQDADNFMAVNVRFVDVYEQILKVSSGPNTYSDNGRVLCSEFEFTAGEAYNDYTRAIDGLKCRNWIISNNVMKGIRSPNDEITEHAILFWRASEGTIVTNNKIMNCDRGIGFGLGDNSVDGHAEGGLIMNNFVHTNRDVGIGVEYAPNVKVYNNTVITENYANSIEYRHPGSTNTRIFNNLVSGNVTRRSDAPEATADDNYRVSDFNIFADAENYDYYLVGTPAGIVDAGTPLSEVTVDIDCDNRISGAGIDIGADEVASSTTTTACPAQLTIDQSITSGIYRAKTIIVPMAAPDNMVSANSEVTFQAEEFVDLESILIPKDADFEIRIMGCGE